MQPTPQRSEIETAIEDALASFTSDAQAASTALRALQKNNRPLFSRSALSLLGSAEASEGSKMLAGLLAADALVIDLLMKEEQIRLSEAARAATHLKQADPLFDVRMIRKVIQDHRELSDMPAPVGLRLLHLLDESSDCSHLTPHLIQLLRHPHQHIRSKSVLLLGRGNMNLSRTQDFLSSKEDRVRANAVESIWDHPTSGMRAILLKCAQDPSQRVAVNALVGLCRLGDAEAPAKLIHLSKSQNPVARAGAAWGMGQVNAPEVAAVFAPVLESLAADPEEKVRNMARRSQEKVAVLTAPEPAIAESS
jgi:hypothetical protein